MLPDFLTDVKVAYSTLGNELEGARERGVLWQAASGRFQIDVPEVARFRVEDGRKITIQPATGCPDERIAQILRMTPLAALLYQRGLLALHAAAVSPPTQGGGAQQAVLLAGDSGAGKSTLAAALVQQGWGLLSDDLTILGLDGQNTVSVWPLPGPLGLWPITIQKLGLQIENQAEANGQVWIDGSSLRAPGRLPLSRIYILTVIPGETVKLGPITSLDGFKALGSLTYHSHIADALLDRRAYLGLASHVVRSCAIARLSRPRGKWSLDELVSKVKMNPGTQSLDKV